MADVMTPDELKWNEQAAGAAGAVLSEQVEAATRCQELKVGMAVGAVGMGKGMQGMANASMSISKGMTKFMGKSMRGVGEMRTGGLPSTWLIAVTPTKVHALECKEKKGKDLSAGKVLQTWDRQGFQAQRGMDIAASAQGVPADRQILTLYLPNQMLANMAPGIGQPTQFMVGRDPASEAVVSALAG